MASILVIDDSGMARRFLKNILVEEGHKIVAEASNGEEGYELFTKHMPDIVMVDITMPVLNGIECLKKIKAEFPNAKVIMVSSLGTERKKEAALNAGAFGFIVKPFDPEVVAEMVDRCLNA